MDVVSFLMLQQYNLFLTDIGRWLEIQLHAFFQLRLVKYELFVTTVALILTLVIYNTTILPYLIYCIASDTDIRLEGISGIVFTFVSTVSLTHYSWRNGMAEYTEYTKTRNLQNILKQNTEYTEYSENPR